MKVTTISNALKFFFFDNYRFRCTILNRLRHSGTLNWMPDAAYIKFVYWVVFKKRINLERPKTFNEKLNWLKLNFRDPLQSRLVDKYEVKPYVSENIGKDFIIKNYGVWDSFDEIDFTQLPNKFVLKCTHDSGSVVICKDKTKFNLAQAREKLTKGLKTNLFYWGREWPYKDVKPRILAEEYLEENSEDGLKDYKFFCFNGQVKCFKVDYNRETNHRANYYSPEGKLLDIGEVICPPNPAYQLIIPNTIADMISLAEILAKGFPFVRVDFYSVNNKIYFGELTFYPAAALSPFIKFDSDIELGNYLKLPMN